MPLCYVESIWSKIVRTLLIIPLFLYALVDKLGALLAGVFLVLLSLIPIPRLTQWCPPTVAIFDGLLALSVGIIFYVLILWVVAGDSSGGRDDVVDDDDDNANVNFRRGRNGGRPSDNIPRISETIDESWKWEDLVPEFGGDENESGGRAMSAKGSGWAEHPSGDESESDMHHQSRFRVEESVDRMNQSLNSHEDDGWGGAAADGSAGNEGVGARAESAWNGEKGAPNTKDDAGGFNVETDVNQETTKTIFKNKDLVGLMYRTA